jgi:hypothetical protein
MRASSLAMWVGLGVAAVAGPAYAQDAMGDSGGTQGFVYEDKDFFFGLAPISGVVLPDITVRNKTEEPLSVDFCHAAFIDSVGKAHTVLPCSVRVLSPGESIHERVWIDGLSGGLPTTSEGARSWARADNGYSLALPVRVHAEAFSIRAKFRLQSVAANRQPPTAGGAAKKASTGAPAQAG